MCCPWPVEVLEDPHGPEPSPGDNSIGSGRSSSGGQAPSFCQGQMSIAMVTDKTCDSTTNEPFNEQLIRIKIADYVAVKTSRLRRCSCQRVSASIRVAPRSRRSRPRPAWPEGLHLPSSSGFSPFTDISEPLTQNRRAKADVMLDLGQGCRCPVIYDL